VRLRISRKAPADARREFTRALRDFPAFTGEPIAVHMRPRLTACRGRLLSNHPGKGRAVHAAAFIRERSVVLESALVRRPAKLRLILTHELFHFVWARLGTPTRRAFADLLRKEVQAGAKGALGESSEQALEHLRTERKDGWRDYVCESFCDTAAWLYAGCVRSKEFTLAARWRERRRRWFDGTFAVTRAC